MDMGVYIKILGRLKLINQELDNNLNIK